MAMSDRLWRYILPDYGPVERRTRAATFFVNCGVVSNCLDPRVPVASHESEPSAHFSGRQFAADQHSGVTWRTVSQEHPGGRPLGREVNTATDP